MKRLAIGLAVAAVLSCNETPEVRTAIKCWASPEIQTRQAAFVVDCAQAANPKSDEEGEDLVEQCQETAQAIIKGTCSSVFQVKVGPNWEPCSLAPFNSRERTACHGWGWQEGESGTSGSRANPLAE